MKKKVTDRDIRLILVLLIIAIIGCSYYFGYQYFNKLTAQTEEEIEVLNGRLAVLEAKKNQIAYYEEQTPKLIEDTGEITKRFLPGELPEDMILFARELELRNGMEIQSVNFGTPEQFYQGVRISEEQVLDDNGVPTGELRQNSYSDPFGLTGYQVTIGISYTTTYQGFKDCIDYINSYERVRAIESISASFDSATGNLTGSMELVLYLAYGTGETYEAPEIYPDFRLGNDNIFGTISPEESMITE